MTKVRIKPRILDVVEDDGMWLDQSTLTYYSKEDVEEVDLFPDLEEAADSAAIKAFPENKSYSTVVDRVVDYNSIDRKNYRDGFIAGAKWQEKLDEETIKTAEDHAFLAGADWQKEQMMKEAVEGVVEDWNPEPHPEITIPLNPEEFTMGDKVKLIVIKED